MRQSLSSKYKLQLNSSSGFNSSKPRLHLCLTCLRYGGFSLLTGSDDDDDDDDDNDDDDDDDDDDEVLCLCHGGFSLLTGSDDDD